VSREQLKSSTNVDVFLNYFVGKYTNPAAILWRAIEAKVVCRAMEKLSYDGPLLDLGCGEGSVSSIVFSENVDVGIDIDPGQVKAASAEKNYKSLIVADGRHLPFRSGTFGVIFSNSVIEHIPGVDDVIREAARVLKHGSYFVFTVPNDRLSEYLFPYVVLKKLGLVSIAQYYSTQRNKRLNHFNLLSNKEWEKKISANDLLVISCSNYLSKTTVEIWDLLAITGFVIKKAMGQRLSRNSESIFEILSAFISTHMLRKYYRLESSEGASTLLVAKLA
jgi:SAM-dependent methyltransferase